MYRKLTCWGKAPEMCQDTTSAAESEGAGTTVEQAAQHILFKGMSITTTSLQGLAQKTRQPSERAVTGLLLLTCHDKSHLVWGGGFYCVRYYSNGQEEKMGGREERKKLIKQFSQNNGKTRGREEILEELLGQNTLDPK